MKRKDQDPMVVTPQCVVALTWTLKDTLGEELDVLDEPVEFLVGGDDLLAKIEEALQGHEAGDTVDLHLEPIDAFGDYDDRLLFLEPRDRFPAELEEGMGFEGLPPGCNPAAPRDRLYFVSDIYPDHVVLDGNHPLAGIAIRIHLKLHSVREATVDEIGQGTLGTGFFRTQLDESSAPPTPPTLH
jgi:FKBP-type peptidyl-prolyl cis-trans isomerase SlyD